MKARMRFVTRRLPVWFLLAPALLLANCASRQPDVGNLVDDGQPKVSAERTAAIADIRRKAEEARQTDTGIQADVYESYGPPDDKRLTYAEIRSIEAELDALAEATRRSTDPGEIAALKREAERLEALRKQVELDGEGGSGSKAQ